MSSSKKTKVAVRRPLDPDGLVVVLDANAIIGRRYRLDGPHVAVMERAISLGKLELIVPRIVLQEILNKYREEVLKAEQRISADIAKLNILLPANRQRAFEPVDTDKVVAEFTNRLIKRLAQLFARHPGYSDIPHADIVRRDLERRRPFREGGRGYRDSLIWETVLRKVASKKLTVLVTENSKDFCSEDGIGALHPDLVADLKAWGLREDAVRVCSTIDAFVDEHLKSLLPTSAQVLKQIQRDQYEMFSFSRFFTESRDAIQEQMNRELSQSGIPIWPYTEVENPQVGYIEDPSSARIREAYELDSERLFLAYDVEADVNLHFFVYKADYYSMPDETDFEIEDPDWNEHYIWASKSVTLPLRFSLVLKLGAPDKVESFDVEFVEFYGWCWKCHAPVQNDAAETCDNCRADLLRPKRRSRASRIKSNQSINVAHTA